MNANYSIAVIITCFNRRDTTIASLKAMYHSKDIFNENHDSKLKLSVFLTDDGCTDGTPDAVVNTFPEQEIHIIKGDGNLFWGGGMRAAWKKAVEQKERWEFYLLLNDDTLCMDNAFEELFCVHDYVVKKHGKSGLYSGVCVSTDGKEFTYGAEYYPKPLIGKSLIMHPTGKPEPCYRTNANLVLVSKDVVNNVGIFDEGFVHCCADWAYGIKANKAGFPVYITANACGICDNDHGSVEDEGKKVIDMNIEERKKFFNHPLHSTADKLLFMKKYYKEKYLLLLFARTCAIYVPSLYYKLLKSRPKK